MRDPHYESGRVSSSRGCFCLRVCACAEGTATLSLWGQLDVAWRGATKDYSEHSRGNKESEVMVDDKNRLGPLSGNVGMRG